MYLVLRKGKQTVEKNNCESTSSGKIIRRRLRTYWCVKKTLRYNSNFGGKKNTPLQEWVEIYNWPSIEYIVWALNEKKKQYIYSLIH